MNAVLLIDDGLKFECKIRFNLILSVIDSMGLQNTFNRLRGLHRGLGMLSSTGFSQPQPRG